MDHEAEQAMEIEALQAILMDDLLEYEGTLPDGWASSSPTYKVLITPADGDDDEEEEYPLQMELLFAHTPQYPEEPPHFRLRAVTGLSDADIASATGVLQQEVNNNLGMAMIYTLIGAAKEWLQARMGGAEEDADVVAKRALEEEERKRTEARAHGTPVTVDTFRSWKAAFDTEMALAKAKLQEGLKDDDKAKRLSGKQYFLQQMQGVDSGMAEAEEDGELSDGDDVDFDPSALRHQGEGGLEDDDDDEDDLDFVDDDDDEEDMLDEYLAEKKS